MFDWLARNHPEELIGLVSVIGCCVVILTAILATQWRKGRQAEAQLRQAELDASLKHEMIARGMSADEICQVLEGRSGAAGVSRPASLRGA